MGVDVMTIFPTAVCLAGEKQLSENKEFVTYEAKYKLLSENFQGTRKGERGNPKGRTTAINYSDKCLIN